MKKALPLVLLVCSIPALRAENLDSLLCTLYDRDQTTRREFAEAMRRQPADPDSLVFLAQRMQEADSTCRQAVFGVLEKHGWPKGLSDKANRAIWIVIDHAGLTAQQRYMPLVEAQARTGNLPMAWYATLYDRICMRRGTPQRYGTQTCSEPVTIVDGRTEGVEPKCYVWPVERSESVDSLRAAGGRGLRQGVHLGPGSRHRRHAGDTMITERDGAAKLQRRPRIRANPAFHDTRDLSSSSRLRSRQQTT